MIEILRKWDLANRRPRKTYPVSLWRGNMCIAYAENYQELIKKFREYLNLAYGDDKWSMKLEGNIYSVSSRNGKIHFVDLELRTRNETVN